MLLSTMPIFTSVHYHQSHHRARGESQTILIYQPHQSNISKLFFELKSYFTNYSTDALHVCTCFNAYLTPNKVTQNFDILKINNNCLDISSGNAWPSLLNLSYYGLHKSRSHIGLHILQKSVFLSQNSFNSKHISQNYNTKALHV